MPMKLNVGDIVQLKKKHPCGEDKWEIMRTGIDFRIKCLGCNRQVWMPRRDLEKRIKKIIDTSEEYNEI
ncbi:hypothetical protein L21TH_1925 [Caldisalinibacter kiritimatiensis]|uniref:DUF951 domain-containing protein n=2 Tax=Caldisalinibacter kiritimatiensis TaxID=1304284 RepID=R1CMX1_9FIRM|nr:hypothetical protein L21TH_1925 [Caldisalinibacter kiritimatiensis]